MCAACAAQRAVDDAADPHDAASARKTAVDDREPRGERDLWRAHLRTWASLLPALNNQEAALSADHLTRMRTALARALSIDDVNQLGLETGQSERLRTIMPHRLFLSTISVLASTKIESLADMLREFNHQNEVTVAYKAFYNRLATLSFPLADRADLQGMEVVREVG